MRVRRISIPLPTPIQSYSLVPRHNTQIRKHSWQIPKNVLFSSEQFLIADELLIQYQPCTQKSQ